jgi:hypothetical protein
MQKERHIGLAICLHICITCDPFLKYTTVVCYSPSSIASRTLCITLSFPLRPINLGNIPFVKIIDLTQNFVDQEVNNIPVMMVDKSVNPILLL